MRLTVITEQIEGAYSSVNQSIVYGAWCWFISQLCFNECLYECMEILKLDTKEEVIACSMAFISN